MLRDKNIRDKVHVIFKEYKAIQRCHNKPAASAKKKVENYLSTLVECFDIRAKNWKESIMCDRLRSADNKEEDINFVIDNVEGPRLMVCGEIDEVYSQKCGQRADRLHKKMLSASSIRAGAPVEDDEVEEDEVEEDEVKEDEVEEDVFEEDEVEEQEEEEGNDAAGAETDGGETDDNDPEFVGPKTKKQKEDSININIPRDIMSQTAEICVTRGISVRDETAYISNLLNVSGVPLSEAKFSKSTANRKRTKVVKNVANKARQDFVKDIEKIAAERSGNKRFLVIHFDTKQVKEHTDGITDTKERLAVFASSPYLPKPQLLGVPAISSSEGTVVVEGLEGLLVNDDWDLSDYVCGSSFDTTASNTGIGRGATVQLQNWLHHRHALSFVPPLWLSCRHHISELHIKHMSQVFRSTSGPDDLVFKRLQDNWLTLLDQGIDYNSLTKFNQGNHPEYLVEKSKESLQYLTLIKSNPLIFSRGDYKEFNNLVIVYLGGDVPNFKFSQPGACHRARFMAKCLYYLKLQLLSYHGYIQSIYTKKELEEICEVAKVIGLFYARWWFMSALPIPAPKVDLLAVSEMRKYARYHKKVSNACLTSQGRHGWYITEELCVFSFFDTTLPYNVRKKMAEKLHNTPRQMTFDLKKPVWQDINQDKFWEDIEDGNESEGLVKLIGERSWVIPNMLEMDQDGVSGMGWLLLDVLEWEHHLGYQKMETFVKGLSVINDVAERGVKLIQDFIGCATREGVRQDTLMTVSKVREKVDFHKATKKQLTKLTPTQFN